MANIELMRKYSMISIDEAKESIKNKSIKSTMLERLELIFEADKNVDGLPQPIKLGKGLYYILGNAKLPFENHDLLLGRIPQVIPNDDEEHYINNFKKIYERPSWLIDWGHITFAWDMLLENGINGMIRLTNKKLRELRGKNDLKDKINYLEGMQWVYKAYQLYIIRYGQVARENGAMELAEICKNIAYNQPRTFYEAVQFILFIGLVYSVYASISTTITYGRVDDLLLPYYLQDIKNGILTKEKAGYIIDDFVCKNNLILGRGEHQLGLGSEKDTGWFRNPTYDSPQYIIIGGYSNNNDHINNPLTELFVQRIVPSLKNPVYVFRYTKDVKNNVWEELCYKMRENGSIIVYNDETEIPAMINAGISKHDAINYTIHACNWPDIPGDYAEISSMYVNLPKRIMSELITEDNTLKKSYHSIDELYSAIANTYREEVKALCKNIRERGKKYNEEVSNVLSCTDCFSKGTIEHAKSIYNGVAKYKVIYNNIRYIGTATDMMTALEKIVFIDKIVTLEVMVDALLNNFKGHENLLVLCRKSNKYGCDDDVADNHGKRLMNILLDIVDNETINDENHRDIHIFNITTTDMDYIIDGEVMMATPDGRLGGIQFSENLSPTSGAANKGVTALLNSVSKLPFNRIHAGAFNLRASKDWLRGEEGVQLLKVVSSTYFKSGGMQVQLSVADTHELHEAQRNPEKYRDLTVRITGYSAIFVDMSKKSQDQFSLRDGQ